MIYLNKKWVLQHLTAKLTDHCSMSLIITECSILLGLVLNYIKFTILELGHLTWYNG